MAADTEQRRENSVRAIISPRFAPRGATAKHPQLPSRAGRAEIAKLVRSKSNARMIPDVAELSSGRQAVARALTAIQISISFKDGSHSPTRPRQQAPMIHGPCWVVYGSFQGVTRDHQTQTPADDGAQPGVATLEKERLDRSNSRRGDALSARRYLSFDRRGRRTQELCFAS